MTHRTIALALVLGWAMASPAQAEIIIGDARYADSKADFVRESCAGLEAQSRQSLTSDVPDDIESGDLASAYALAQLPFSLRDCRAAGYR